MDIRRDTPISSVEEAEVSIDEDSDDGAQYSPTQAKINRITAGRSARSSTLSPAMLLHVPEPSPVSRIGRRAKTEEPVTMTSKKDSQPWDSFRKESSGMGFQDFLSSLSSGPDAAIARSLPRIFPDALKGKVWAEACKLPTESDRTGQIYVFKTEFPSTGLHASPRGAPGNVVIKVGKTTDIKKRKKQLAANTKCNLKFELLNIWNDVANHGRVEQIILVTLGRKIYRSDCGSGCTTTHDEMFEVHESELPYVYEIIDEWVAWGKNI